MRPTLVGLALTVVLPIAAAAQARDSSYWTLGVARGGFNTSSSGTRTAHASIGSMQVEWRRFSQRLGVRVELGVADRSTLWDDSFRCASCVAHHDESGVGLITAAVYEWRQQRMLRPYVIGGAGVVQSAASRVEATPNPAEPFALPSETVTFRDRRMSLVTSGGFGLSANVRRVSAFAEVRGRSGSGPSELWSIGFRIRPN
jgi:hypothetical protein